MKKQNLKKPFFSNFLENQLNKNSEPEIQGGRPTAPLIDTPQTNKHPSDADEDVTLKYPSDSDEYVTHKYPSDSEDDVTQKFPSDSDDDLIPFEPQ